MAEARSARDYMTRLPLSFGVMQRQPAGGMDTDAGRYHTHMTNATIRARGGRAGGFRVAAGFSALAALGAAYQAWSVSHPSPNAVVFYAPSLAAAVGVGAALFAGASVLALQHRAVAGLCLLTGYVIPAATLYAQQATIIPPSLLIVVSMMALIIATRRTSTVNDPAA